MPTCWHDRSWTRVNRPGERSSNLRKDSPQPDRSLDRQASGARLPTTKELPQLERIIHPRVAREQQRLVRRIAKRKPHTVVIYEYRSSSKPA